MNARRVRAVLDKLEKAIPALPVPATPKEPVDWTEVTMRLIEGWDGEGLDEASRRAFDDLLPYREVIREFALEHEARERAYKSGNL